MHDCIDNAVWAFMLCGADSIYICEDVHVYTMHCLAAAYCGSSTHDVNAVEQVCFACDTLKQLIVLDNSALTCCLRDGYKHKNSQVGSVFFNSSSRVRCCIRCCRKSETCVISDSMCHFGTHDSAGILVIHTRFEF